MLHLCSCWLTTSPPHHILFGWCLCLPTFVSFVSLLWDLAGSKEGKGSALFTSLLSVRSSLSSEFLGMHRHHPIVIFAPVRTKVVSRFQVCLFHKEAHFVTLECRIFSLLSWGSYEPNFIFAEFGEREREVQAISFYWSFSPWLLIQTLNLSVWGHTDSLSL